MTMGVIGLDLAGSTTRTTGFCLMNESLVARTQPLHTNKEILSKVFSQSPEVVLVDAPLSLPKGRKSLSHRGPPHFRACDLELRRMKIPFFPLSLGPMRKLTARGMKLRKVFESSGVKVLESYPGGIQDMLGMPRKNAGLEKLRAALIQFGVTGDVTRHDITHDELDAITLAILGRQYLEGNYLVIGDPDEGQMILPRAGKN